jgi:hypothetical protein
MSDFRVYDYTTASVPKPTKAVVVHSETDLRDLLSHIARRGQAYLELISPEDHTLTIGIAGRYGFVMFTAASGNPPYLWASRKVRETNTDVEFSIGGTPTPIPLNRCIMVEHVIEIASHYFRCQELSNAFEWEAD